MPNPLKWLEEFNRKHKGLGKVVKTAGLIVIFLLGYFTNVFLANGIVLINHYVWKEDYTVDLIDIHSQYFSQTQKNFTILVKNEWSSDLATRVDVYSKPSNNGITFSNVLCDNSPCKNNPINVAKQSFVTITVAMDIGSIEQSKFSICAKASEYGNEANAKEVCYPSDIIDGPIPPK